MKKYIAFLPLTIVLISIQCSSEMDDTDDLVIDETITTEIVSDSNSTDNNNNSNSSSSDSDSNSFNHKEMLTNWVDNIIIPSITNFDNSLEIFEESATTFVNAPT